MAWTLAPQWIMCSDYAYERQDFSTPEGLDGLLLACCCTRESVSGRERTENPFQASGQSANQDSTGDTMQGALATDLCDRCAALARVSGCYAVSPYAVTQLGFSTGQRVSSIAHTRWYRGTPGSDA